MDEDFRRGGYGAVYKAAFALLLLLVLGCTLAGALSISSFRDYDEEHRLMQRAGGWNVVQAEYQLLQLVEALDGYVAQPQRADKVRLLEQFEVYAARLPLLLEGRQATLTRRMPIVHALTPGWMRQAEALRPRLEALRVDDLIDYQEVRARLGLVRGPLQEIVRSAVLTRPLDATGAIFAQLHLRLVGFMGGSFVATLLLLALLVVQLRRHGTLLALAGEANEALQREIGARRESEERLLSVSENLPGHLFQRLVRPDRTTELRYYSPQFLKLVNATAEAVRADGSFGISNMHAEDRNRYLEALHSGPEAPALLRMDVRIDGDPERWLRISARRTWQPDGNALWTGVSLDVTDEKRALEREAELRRQLVLSQRREAVGTLAGGMAHNINNALVPILGFTELAKLSAPDQPELQQSLDTVLASARQVRDLVRALLAHSLDRAAPSSTFDAVAETRSLVSIFQPSCPAGIEFRLLLPERPIHLTGDASELRQVLTNLLLNASQAIGRRPGRIEVGLEATDGPPEAGTADRGGRPWLHLWIADDGPGMDGRTLQRIFDPFFTTKPPGEGTGLGLSVSSALVATAGGRLDASSQPGAGSRFDLHLPATRQEPQAAPATG